MSEPRKVPLISNGFGAAATDPPEKKKKAAAPARSQRFTLTLSDPTDTSCSEFSYLDLRSKAAESSAPEIDPNDPFAAKDQADHDKMVRLAQAYETKYAPKPSGGKRKRRDRVEDLVDLGDGYDESDSFVDNTEAYDEYIPCTMSTKHGGFYINCGQLDLIPVDEEFVDDEGDEDDVPMRKKRKNNNRLSDSDEESGDVRSKGKNGDGVMKKKRNKELLFGGEKKRKRSNLGEQLPSGAAHKSEKLQTVAQILSASTQNSITSMADPSSNIKPIVPTVTDKLRECLSARTASQTQCCAPTVEPSPSAVPGGTGVQSSIDSAIDAVISRTRGDPDPPNSASYSIAKPPATDDYATSPELVDAVTALTTLAQTCEGHKIRQFTPDVNRLLLTIDSETRGTPCAAHNRVFAQLGGQFACGWEGLMKRVRKLRLRAQEDRLRQPLAELREAVEGAMPPLLERYREELNAAEKLRQERAAVEQSKELTKDYTKDAGKDVQRDNQEDESDEENLDDNNHEGAGNGGGGGAGNHPKRILNPRRKFAWTPALRLLLCRIVMLRMELYELARIKSQSAEEHLRAFLDSDVKPVWPPGWMHVRSLFKESRAAHAQWTAFSVMKATKKVAMDGKGTVVTPQGQSKSSVLGSEKAAVDETSARSLSQATMNEGGTKPTSDYCAPLAKPELSSSVAKPKHQDEFRAGAAQQPHSIDGNKTAVGGCGELNLALDASRAKHSVASLISETLSFHRESYPRAREASDVDGSGSLAGSSANMKSTPQSEAASGMLLNVQKSPPVAFIADPFDKSSKDRGVVLQGGSSGEGVMSSSQLSLMEHWSKALSTLPKEQLMYLATATSVGGGASLLGFDEARGGGASHSTGGRDKGRKAHRHSEGATAVCTTTTSVAASSTAAQTTADIARFLAASQQFARTAPKGQAGQSLSPISYGVAAFGSDPHDSRHNQKSPVHGGFLSVGGMSTFAEGRLAQGSAKSPTPGGGLGAMTQPMALDATTRRDGKSPSAADWFPVSNLTSKPALGSARSPNASTLAYGSPPHTQTPAGRVEGPIGRHATGLAAYETKASVTSSRPSALYTHVPMPPVSAGVVHVGAKEAPVGDAKLSHYGAQRRSSDVSELSAKDLVAQALARPDPAPRDGGVACEGGGYSGSHQATAEEVVQRELALAEQRRRIESLKHYSVGTSTLSAAGGAQHSGGHQGGSGGGQGAAGGVQHTGGHQGGSGGGPGGQGLGKTSQGHAAQTGISSYESFLQRQEQANNQGQAVQGRGDGSKVNYAPRGTEGPLQAGLGKQSRPIGAVAGPWYNPSAVSGLGADLTSLTWGPYPGLVGGSQQKAPSNLAAGGTHELGGQK